MGGRCKADWTQSTSPACVKNSELARLAQRDHTLNRKLAVRARFYFPLVSMLLALWPVNSARAQESQAVSWRGNWNGMDVVVTIVARGHTIPETVRKSLPWWQWGNTTTDAYLFCLNDPGRVDLVLDFSVVGDHPQATLYPVKAEYSQQVKISEHGYELPPQVKPALSIWSRQGKWLVAGEPNYNLDSAGDGSIKR